VENLRYIESLRKRSAGIQLLVEFRHESWDTDEMEEQVRSLDVTWVSVDEPELEGLISRRIRATSDIAYVRMHGRNAAAWYNKAAGDRYDYDYSEQELTEWGERLLSLKVPVRKAYILFNNCYHGQAPRNAQWLKQWMQEKYSEETESGD
jgi:uncharacterized protein YecE (DUF72 family)